ncbi:MAG: hypothetical protein AAF927_30940 [Bacteroidota bacterium]
MMKHLTLTSLLLSLILLSSCTASKQLRAHRTELDRLANVETDSQKKFDGFATVVATALDEATNFESPIRTVRYLQRFTKKNQDEIVLLTDQLEEYLKSLNSAQRMALVGRSLTKPYGRKLARLIPKINKMVENGDFELGPLERTLGLFALKQAVKRR